MISSRIDLKNRTKLEMVVPLKTPYIIYIDPSAVCNFSCKFCYQSDKEQYKQIKGSSSVMTIDEYKSIIDSLSMFPDKIKVIRLYSYGEPLINKRFCAMVKYAKESGYVDRVDTTTNGSLLNPGLNADIIDSGINRINISVNGLSVKQFKDFTGVGVDFKKYVDNIKHLFEIRKDCYLFIKINGDTLSNEDKQKFLDIFESIADGVAIERTMGCWNEFEVKANDSKGIYNQDIGEVLVCPYIFYVMTIQSDCTTSMCSIDWNRKLITGNAKQNSVYDIWNGNIMNGFRKRMLNGERKEIPVCCNCGQLTHGNPDNIDSNKKQLMSKFK